MTRCNTGIIILKAGESMTLRETRLQAHLTQVQAAEKLGISLRSYKTYENDAAKADTFK